jgi:hypothetical protein
MRKNKYYFEVPLPLKNVIVNQKGFYWINGKTYLFKKGDNIEIKKDGLLYINGKTSKPCGCDENTICPKCAEVPVI